MDNESLTNEENLINESKLNDLITEIDVVKFNDYTALDIVQLLSICYVPI